jgi:hypothetical protein
MPVSELHRQVATIALSAAAEHGFALGGGNALLAHGVTSRPTLDVVMRSVMLSGCELSQKKIRPQPPAWCTAIRHEHEWHSR